jgi:hypothetical protein
MRVQGGMTVAVCPRIQISAMVANPLQSPLGKGGRKWPGLPVWYLAIARLDLGRSTAIVVPSIPLLSLVASFLLLGEVPTLPQCVGLVFIAAGVLAFVTAPQALIAEERIPSLTAPVATPAGTGDGQQASGG